MTSDGQTLYAPLVVVKDPRNSATDQDLKSQFDFALQVQEEIKVARALQAKIEAIVKRSKSSTEKGRLTKILGGGGTGNPDEGGLAASDFGSLRRIIDGLGGIYGATESAPSAPLMGYRSAFKELCGRIDAIVHSIRGTK